MQTNPFLAAGQAALLASPLLLLALAGCATSGSDRSSHYPARPGGARPTMLMVEEDYDYYPRYEIYYSRRRNEYVYRDANAWVRRNSLDLRGITLDMLSAGPSVRVDFHDSPEYHHNRIVQSFPRNWEQPRQGPGDRKDQRKNQDDRKKGDRRDDKKDEHKDGDGKRE